MKDFQKIVNDISALKIQGASNVTKAAVKALYIIASEYKNTNKSFLIKNLERAKSILFKTRPTEPGMRNTLNYILFDIKSEENVFDEIKSRVIKTKEHLENIREEIGKIGSKKIIKGSVVFTHCHSSTVVSILKQAKKQGKRFQLHNTETRPLFQGRITAREVSRLGIPVTHYVDSAARLALKKADIMLIGADAITSEGKVINKIGSEMFAEIADKYDIPVYVCTDSWKFDPLSVFGYEEEIEIRSSKEVWPTAPKGVKIDNFAFEKIDSDLITGIISEIGVYKPEIFVEEVKRAYPWMF